MVVGVSGRSRYLTGATRAVFHREMKGLPQKRAKHNRLAEPTSRMNIGAMMAIPTASLPFLVTIDRSEQIDIINPPISTLAEPGRGVGKALATLSNRKIGV